MVNLLQTKFVQIFIKSPITVLLLLAVVALAYSQEKNDTLYREQIKGQREEIRELKSEVKALQDKIFEIITKKS